MLPPLIGIVDDEEGMRRALGRLLDAHAFRIQSFATGAEFLAEVRRRHFDCLLLDLLMPGMSGLDVLDQLRREPMAPPVIVICGADDPELFERALALDAFECHGKPIAQEALIGAIGRALQRRATA